MKKITMVVTEEWIYNKLLFNTAKSQLDWVVLVRLHLTVSLWKNYDYAHSSGHAHGVSASASYWAFFLGRITGLALNISRIKYDTFFFWNILNMTLTLTSSNTDAKQLDCTTFN